MQPKGLANISAQNSMPTSMHKWKCPEEEKILVIVAVADKGRSSNSTRWKSSAMTNASWISGRQS